MKLWIDDIRNAPDESWHVVRTVTDAIEAIYRFAHEIEEVSIDHDVEGSMETFKPVAHFMAAHALRTFWEPKVTIHTVNPDGAVRIKQILEEARIKSEYKPIGFLKT